MHSLNSFLNSIYPIIQQSGFWGYWFILLIAFLESLVIIGVFLPGTTAIAFMGFFASKGFFNVEMLILFSTVGSMLGDFVSYYLGKKGKILFKSKFDKSELFVKGEKFIEKHGGKSIFLGRFIAGVKPVMPFAAGVLKMKMKRFVTWEIITCASWSAAYILLGFFCGRAINFIEAWSARIGVIVVVALIFAIIVYLSRRFLIKKGKAMFSLLKSAAISVKETLLENSFVTKHIKGVHVITERFSVKKFRGLPLTLLAVAFMCAGLLFFGITKGIVKSQAIVDLDMNIKNLLYFYRDPYLVKGFIWVTTMGEWEVVVGGSAVLLAIFLLWKKKEYILPFLIILVGSNLFQYIGKLIVERARPGSVAAISEAGFSFPSGHSTTEVAFYGFLTYFLIKSLDNWQNKINFFFIGIIAILAIGFSRMYLGVHFFSDVIGGFLVGLMWLIIGTTIREFLHKREKPNAAKSQNAQQNNLKIKLITGILVTTQTVFFFLFGFTIHPLSKNINEQTHQENLTVTKNVDDLFTAGSSLSKFTEGAAGAKAEPLSFIIITKNEESLLSAFNKIGWYKADKPDIGAMYELAKATILNESYKEAPVGASFWQHEVQDFAFEKETDANTVKKRHYIKIWNTHVETENKGYIYVGTAGFDEGFRWDFSHKIKPDIDAEREFVFNELQKSNDISTYEKNPFVEPMTGKNFWGDSFRTDGQIYIIYLK